MIGEMPLLGLPIMPPGFRVQGVRLFEMGFLGAGESELSALISNRPTIRRSCRFKEFRIRESDPLIEMALAELLSKQSGEIRISIAN